jgi:hypothetical protein
MAQGKDCGKQTHDSKYERFVKVKRIFLGETYRQKNSTFCIVFLRILQLAYHMNIFVNPYRVRVHAGDIKRS